MFEKTSRHLLIKIVQIRLNFSLAMLNYLDDIPSVLAHVLSEAKLLADILALVELDISRFKEVSPDSNVPLDLSFTHHPP